MYRILIVLITLFVSNNLLFAQQEIYIPYRNGKLWGIANYESKLIIEPKYDSVAFVDNFNYSFIKVYQNNNQGLVINGKEALSCNYNNINLIDNYFIEAKNENGSYIYDLNGFPIIHQSVKKFEPYLLIGKDTVYLVLHLFYSNNKEDLIVWNPNKKEAVVLLKEYASIKFIRQKNNWGLYLNEMNLLLKKLETDLLIEANYTILNYNLTKTIPDSVVEKNKNAVTSNYDLYESDNISGIGPPYDEMKDYKVEKHYYENSNPVIVYNNIVEENKSFYVVTKTIVNNKPSIKREKIKLPKQFSNFKIEKYRETIIRNKENDSNIYYFDFLTFDNQKGIFSINNETIIYDTLIALKNLNSIYQNKNFYALGNLNKKNNQFSYYLYNHNFIKLNDQSFDTIISNQNYFKIRKNNKFGLLNFEGKTAVAPIYDEIKFINKNNNKTFYWEIIDNEKHGVFYTYNDTKPVFIPPIFNYSIKDIYYQYPNFTNNNFSKNTANYSKYHKVILELKDKSNKRLGFANADGILYFKD